MPTIGLALIAKNEAENLKRLIPQLTSYLDQIVVVDTGSTDTTKEIAASLGAEVYDYPGEQIWIRYKDPNDPSKRVEFLNVASFGDARTFAFSKLTTDWQGWCDADDIWEGLDKLRPMLDEIEAKRAPINAVWLMYDYDQMPLERSDGTQEWRTTAEHRRERFVRKGTGWHWVRPVHEHMIVDDPAKAVNVTSNDIVVHHRRDRSKDYGRNERNIRILRNVLKQNPKDARALFDLATQYYNARRFWRSLAMHRRFLTYADSDIEAYQAWHHAADCWRFLGHIDKANVCDKQATALHDEWADAWFGLAENAFAERQFQKALTRLKYGYAAGKPNDFLVLNPLDYTFLPKVTEQRSLAATGRIEEALKLVDELLPLAPTDPELNQAKATYTQIMTDIGIQRNALELGTQLGDLDKEVLFSTLPERVKGQKQVRDELLIGVHGEKRTPDVLIWCGPSLEEWGPETPNLTGIGGSETAVIYMAQELGDLGLNVDVYNMCGRQEGRYGNVRYLDHTRFKGDDEHAKLAVAWRNPGVGPFLKADHRWLWMHDLHAGPGLNRALAEPFTAVRPVSKWHGWYLEQAYPFLRGKISPTRNGIQLNRFNDALMGDIARSPHKAIYCSSPDRGLIYLLNMWPVVRRHVPDAELHVFYGWESYDRTIQQTGRADLLQFKQQVLQALKQPGVFARGRLNQDELAAEMRSAAILAYPSTFLEVSCITAIECMAAGTVVLSTICGALPETLADAGMLVRGSPMTDAYQNQFTKFMIGYMKLTEIRDKLAARGLERAKAFSWKGVAQEWADRIDTRSVAEVA